MNYNFDTIVNRANTNSIKYDFAAEKGKPPGLLPLWVADMDFPAPREVLDDIRKAVEHGVFGYTDAKEEYYNAVINWFSKRFNFSFSQQDIVKCPGVVFALSQVIRAFTNTGESVLIQTPVYHPFFSIIKDNERKLVTNPLVYLNGTYSIDFEDFERKIVNENVKLFILCSPHNPVGRVWTKKELTELKNICEKHGVIVASDEIHCDFVYSGNTHTSYGLLSDNAIIATAPSKTFNLAGLQVSNIIIKNSSMRRKLYDEIKKTGYGDLNTLGIISCQSAYLYGGDWLEQLKPYLFDNIQFAKSFIEERLPKIKFIAPQGTYLIWLDFSEYKLTQKQLDERITHNAKLWLNSGTMFGEEGEGFQRINIACPRATLAEALLRLESGFKI